MSEVEQVQAVETLAPEEIADRLEVDDRIGIATFFYLGSDRRIVMNGNAARMIGDYPIGELLADCSTQTGHVSFRTTGGLYKYDVFYTTLEGGDIIGTIRRDTISYLRITLEALQHRLRNFLTVTEGAIRFLIGDHGNELLKLALKNCVLMGYVLDRMTLITFHVDQSKIEIFDIADLVNDMKSNMNTLGVSIRKSSNAIVRADSNLIGIVLVNLLSNAYIHAGEDIDVYIDIETGVDEVTVSVTDTGCGIKQKRFIHLFEPFDSVHHRGERKIGMGLWLSKLIVDAMGGRIWVESEVGSGSTFSFSLPLAEGLPDYNGAPEVDPP